MIDSQLALACQREGREPMTNREIAALTGLSEQRVGSILNGALDKLRRKLAKDPDLSHLFPHDHRRSNQTR